MQKNKRFFVHSFSDLNTAKFSAVDYSKLKFGSDIAAMKLGSELATEFFAAHADSLLANKCVVIPSPYNFIKNAATVLTTHFCNKLNALLVKANGEHVDYSIIHRKVSYTNDYGFLSKEKRKGLIDNDSFYLNRDFIEGKLLIFVDDVRITGTHEDKLVEILERDGIKNETFFLYYASYQGLSPSIEADLNFAGMKNMEDYVELMNEPNHHVIVRPLKYVLSQTEEVLENILPKFTSKNLANLYHGCLGEGYYKIPSYQKNFNRIAKEISIRELMYEELKC